MEFQHPTSQGFRPLASANILLLLLLLVAMNLSVNHALAAIQLQNETDRLALLEFKHQISDDPYGVLKSWNHTQHHCQWQGVTCDIRHKRIIALTLRGKSLSGTVSPHIGNLSFMKFIHLGQNQFRGEIPQELGRLFRLRLLNLSSNALSGKVPVNLSQCSQLRTMGISRNKLEGKIPAELGSLKKLEHLSLMTNNLTGEIPSSIGNLSSLASLTFAYNNLEGSLPNKIGFLASLSLLAVQGNKLSGMIPASIYNISTIVILSVAGNSFHGSLPTTIGLTLPNLQALGIGGNKFSGNIPISITNSSRLEILDLPDNKLEGQVPANLGHLLNLQRLNLERNLLGSSSRGDLGFIASLTNCSKLRVLSMATNNLGGELPLIMANLSSQLTEFFIGDNQLQGTIPEGLGNLVNLYRLGMSSNSLSGTIPSDFGKFQNLQFLALKGNKLSGKILSTLCNITTLYHLDLSVNQFEGHNIFGNVLMNCQNLQELDLSQNNLSGVMSPDYFVMHPSLVYLNLALNIFSGSLPLEVGKLMHLVFFNASYNNFSGEIPATLGDILGLEYLNMQGNFFEGVLPPNLASLKSIQQLDLSNNKLTGQIPKNLGKLKLLRYLNISYNDLEGEIPTTGIFANASQITLIGNHKLCGGIPELGFPSCPMIKGKSKGKFKVIIALSTVIPITAFVLGTLLFYSVIYSKRYMRKASFSNVPTRVNKLLRVSYYELHNATSGFSPENLIGSGSFGFVYKGRLHQHGDRLVAVKVFDLQKNGASKSFKAECKALRNIRHRNLVSILSYCSSIDSRSDEFKALIYEFMENGNLDFWLHPETTDQTTGSSILNISQRLNIAIDVASALQYLHNQCETEIVHCDLKPSNILLDNDLVAHVGDFGLSRLLPKTVSTSSGQESSSTIAIKGSIGYAAPEYGMGHAASSQGDVYSYGILLLEMITSKRPTDDMFMDGLDLHSYVSMALSEQVFKIVDPLLLASGDENGEIAAEEQIINGERKMECIISLLKIGLKCSVRLPNDRMHMNEVIRKLHLIKDAFFGAKIHTENLDA